MKNVIDCTHIVKIYRVKIDKHDLYMTEVDYFAPNVCNMANYKKPKQKSNK